MFTPAQVTAHLVRAARMLGSARRPRRRLPRQQPPMLLEKEYAREVMHFVAARLRFILEPLHEAAHTILVAARPQSPRGDVDDTWRADAGEGKRVRELAEAARARVRSTFSTSDIEALAEKFAVRVSTYQRIQLARQTKAALGVDVIANDRKLPMLVENFAANNVALIRDIGEQTIIKTELAIQRAVQDGKLYGDLAKELQTIGYGETRAELVARDQVGKLYGQINATRQKELGADRFIWRTVGDERVRDEHAELDGEEFSYSAGGHPEEGLPGEAILCRCWAEPVFDEVIDLFADDE